MGEQRNNVAQIHDHAHNGAGTVLFRILCVQLLNINIKMVKIKTMGMVCAVCGAEGDGNYIHSSNCARILFCTKKPEGVSAHPSSVVCASPFAARRFKKFF